MYCEDCRYQYDDFMCRDCNGEHLKEVKEPETDQWEARVGWYYELAVPALRFNPCPMCGTMVYGHQHKESVCTSCWFYGYDMCG